jgi:hypothetical protein
MDVVARDPGPATVAAAAVIGVKPPDPLAL